MKLMLDGKLESQLESQADDLLLKPDRIGHATFLSDATVKHVLEHRIPIEICVSSNQPSPRLIPAPPLATSSSARNADLSAIYQLSSNLICKTASSLEAHHLSWAIRHDLPVLLCTDDTLIFQNTLEDEYTQALSLCTEPRLKSMYHVVLKGIEGLFCDETEKRWVKERLESWWSDVGTRAT